MNTFTEHEMMAALAVRTMANNAAGRYSNEDDWGAAIVALLLEALGQELDDQGIDRSRFLTLSEE